MSFFKWFHYFGVDVSILLPFCVLLLRHWFWVYDLLSSSPFFSFFSWSPVSSFTSACPSSFMLPDNHYSFFHTSTHSFLHSFFSLYQICPFVNFFLRLFSFLAFLPSIISFCATFVIVTSINLLFVHIVFRIYLSFFTYGKVCHYFLLPFFYLFLPCYI